jgi:hypothetical protein
VSLIQSHAGAKLASDRTFGKISCGIDATTTDGIGMTGPPGVPGR